MSTTSKVMTGVLVGVSVGIIAGILIAPDSGKRTREKLAEKAKNLKSGITGKWDDAKSAYNNEVDSLMANGKSGINSLKNALKV
jgi:gas vesicle protein